MTQQQKGRTGIAHTNIPVEWNKNKVLALERYEFKLLLLIYHTESWCNAHACTARTMYSITIGNNNRWPNVRIENGTLVMWL